MNILNASILLVLVLRLSNHDEFFIHLVEEEARACLKVMSIFKLWFKLESISRCFWRQIYMFLKALVFHENKIKKEKNETLCTIVPVSNASAVTSVEAAALRADL